MTLDLAKVRADVSIRGMDIGLFRGEWALDGWNYRRPVTITEQSGNDLTDFQVLVELDGSNFNFVHAQSNGEDVRFTDTEGNLLSYWIEEWDAANEKAEVWVKVPFIPANSEIEIYMYYGNPTVASASDGEATFEFFDDFEGDKLDTSKWVDVDANPSVSDSILTISTGYGDIRSIKGFTAPYIIESKHEVTTSWSGFVWGVDSTELRGKILWIIYNQYQDGNYWDLDDNVFGSYEEVYITVEAGWKKFTIKVLDSSGKAKIYRDGIYDFETTYNSGYTDGGFIAIHNYEDIHEWDWILVRKYTLPEPSVSLGVEETA